VRAFLRIPRDHPPRAALRSLRSLCYSVLLRECIGAPRVSVLRLLCYLVVPRDKYRCISSVS